MNVGIQDMNFYGGAARIDIKELFRYRGLDDSRLGNLLMESKSIGLPCEDPVSNAVNAAKPIIDGLTEEEKNSIELLITASESGIDFSKSLSTYVHEYLGLSKNCSVFEIKHACYGGTAALHMASTFIASGASPGAKALVVATDVTRAAIKNTYAEPSQGTGAVAMLVSSDCPVLTLDFGARGNYSYEVMDTYRPLPEIETGDPDLSLLSYLDCLTGSFRNYQEKVDNVDVRSTFDFYAFHAPFGGMVKGGFRSLMKKFGKMKPPEIESEFKEKVLPSLDYCKRVGNVYSASVYLSLCGLIDSANLKEFNRVGLFSYGSGCSSSFYSGIVTPRSKAVLGAKNIKGRLEERCELSIEEYDRIGDINMEWVFGIKDKEVDFSAFSKQYERFFEGKGLLVLNKIQNYHRKYSWS